MRPVRPKERIVRNLPHLGMDWCRSMLGLVRPSTSAHEISVQLGAWQS